jgi:hypothetical protein
MPTGPRGEKRPAEVIGKARGKHMEQIRKMAKAYFLPQVDNTL